MKKIFSSLIFIGFFNMLLIAKSPMGFVDMERVFKEFKGFSQVEEEMQKDISSWRQKASEMKAYVDNMRKDVESRRTVLSEEAYKREMDKVKEEEDKYEAFVDSIWGENGKIQKRYEEMIKPMVDVMYNLINKIAEDEGYFVIMDSSQGGVIYVSKENDITDMVIEALNYEYGIMTKEIKVVLFDMTGTGDIVKENLLDVKLADSLRTRLGSLENVTITGNKEARNELQKNNIMPGDSIPINTGQEAAQNLETDYFVIGSVKSSGESITIKVSVYATQTATEVLSYEESVDNIANISFLLDRIAEKIYNSIK